MEEQQQRQVKGIWIPIEIWKDKNLTWNEKILFLEIDSYTSKDKDCYFSNEYISELLGISVTNASKNISSLIEKGYIVKTKFDGRKRYVKSALSYSTSLHCQEQQGFRACANIIDSNNIDNTNKTTTKEEKELKEKSDSLFEECWKAYRRKGSKKKSLEQWKKLTDKEQSSVLSHIKAYVDSREMQFQKDFERYLRDKVFNDVVFAKNGYVAYDPSKGSTNEYNPHTDLTLMWNDYYKCYMYMGFYNGYIPDGYNDEDRPNGASVTLNNSRGIVVWNKEKKQWIKE